MMLSALLMLLPMFSSPTQTQLEERAEAVTAVIAAEKAFAELSQKTGMRTAFMANLAVDSIVFQPGPVDGREAYRESLDVAGMLQWKPVFADAAASGELGYTTGPWVFRDGQRLVHGHYVTVWRKHPEGGWKVVIDAGVPHAEPGPSGDSVDSPEPGEEVETGDESPRESLLAADRGFSTAARENGFLAALLAAADANLRVYRPGSLPLIGRQSVESALTSEPHSWTWEPSDGEASDSGDLGYTYGVARTVPGASDPQPEAANAYLRIWKRGAAGDWKIVLDLANPLPPADK